MEMLGMTQLWTAILVISWFYLLTKVLKNCIWWRSYLRFYKQVQGPDFHKIWGHAFIHPGPTVKGLAYDMQNTIKFKTHYLLYFGRWRPTLVLVHPESVKQVMRTAAPKMFQGGGYGLMKPWLGMGLLLSGGAQWSRNRRLLTPGFHFDILKSYIPVYNEAVDVMISNWRSQCDTGTSMEISEPISLMTLDVMLRCAFNYDAKIQITGQSHQYVKAVRFLNDEISRRLFDFTILSDFVYFKTPMGRKNLRITNYVHSYSTEIIENRKRHLSENGKNNAKRFVDFLDVLLLARDGEGKGLSDQEIRQEADTFLFEGHDTTKSALSWILYALASNPQCQTKAYDEIKQLFDKKSGDDVDLDDLNEIPYLTMCLKEAMRLYTTVPLVSRELAEPTVICGQEYPKDTLVFLYLYMLHHNPDVWGDDHNTFRPERFHPDRIQDMDPYAYVPFSGGPRNCIGQQFVMHEIKVTLIKILREFEFVADKEKPAKPIPGVVLVSETGLNVYLKKRTHFHIKTTTDRL